MTRISELASQLLTENAKTIGQHFALMPLRIILELRSILLEIGQHALLVEKLLEGLKHSEARVRYNCALAMDHIADERCSEPLRALFEDTVPKVRRAALHSLSCETCKVTPLPMPGDLIETLSATAMSDLNIRVRRTAVDSLAETCTDPRVIPALQALEATNTDAGMQQRLKRALKTVSLNSLQN